MKPFTIKNDQLEALKPRFDEAIDLIKRSTKSMVVIRHHADTDGYAAGLAIEEAVLPLLEKDGNNPRYNFRRFTSRSPYYDYADALRDLDFFYDARNYDKGCLLILADLGSGDESRISLDRVKAAGVKVILIDHHVPNSDTIKLPDIVINPHVIGGNSELCAGILCYELACQFKEIPKIFPAVAAIGDKSNIKEYLDGFDIERLRKLMLCIEYEAYYSRYMDSVEDIFAEKTEVVQAIWREVLSEIEDQQIVIETYMEKDVINGITIMKLNMDQINYDEFGGKRSVGMMNNLIDSPRVSYGYSSGRANFRADKVSFKLSELIKLLKSRFPYALISGGGHDKAGAIRFIPASTEVVMKAVDEYIASCNIEN